MSFSRILISIIMINSTVENTLFHNFCGDNNEIARIARKLQNNHRHRLLNKIY